MPIGNVVEDTSTLASSLQVYKPYRLKRKEIEILYGGVEETNELLEGWCVYGVLLSRDSTGICRCPHRGSLTNVARGFSNHWCNTSVLHFIGDCFA